MGFASTTQKAEHSTHFLLLLGLRGCWLLNAILNRAYERAGEGKLRGVRASKEDLRWAIRRSSEGR